jgi:hypothetical protein
MLKMNNPYWVSSDTCYGPTESGVAALTLVKERSGSLSNGEGILLRIVFDLWNGSGEASLWDIINGLDPGVAQALGELLMVIPDADPELIDRWEEHWKGYDPAKEFFSS